jgi:ribosomal protein S18 acetylase RimI-like enzyme
LLAEAHTGVLVAEAGEGAGATVIGVVLVRIFDTPDDPAMAQRRRGHVEALVVDEHHRRAGIGTALMDAAAAWARARGARELVLTVWDGNTAAEGFYRRLGYAVISRVMRRSLT